MSAPRAGERRAVSWPAVLEAVERHAWAGGELTGVTEDSRAVAPGAVFVARGGFSVDGHRFVAEAEARGASVIVCERAVETRLPTCRVPDGRRALSALADAWYGHPSHRLRVAGVTGTNGKTTTAWFVAAILKRAGLATCTVGTAGVTALGSQRRHLPWTTPPPGELHRILAGALERGKQAAVLEVSAQGLSQHRVDDCAFDAGAVTNLAPEHGEYYPDHASYRYAKSMLLRLLGTQGKPAAAVLNAGLAHLEEFRRACAVPQLEFGPEGELRALDVTPRGLSGTDLRLRLPGGRGDPVTIPVRLRLPGAHNVENALCAAAIAHVLGVPPAEIARGLSSLRGVPGRLQHVQRVPFRVLVDYAHNPAGLQALLTLLRQATPGRLVLVLGARGRRDPGKRPLTAAVAAAFCDRVVLTSDRPAGEDPAEAAEPMRAALCGEGVAVTFEPDRLRALERGVERLRAGDCLVVAGKGDETWGDDDTSRPGRWDDPRALRSLLARDGLPLAAHGGTPR